MGVGEAGGQGKGESGGLKKGEREGGEVLSTFLCVRVSPGAFLEGSRGGSECVYGCVCVCLCALCVCVCVL